MLLRKSWMVGVGLALFGGVTLVATNRADEKAVGADFTKTVRVEKATKDLVANAAPVQPDVAVKADRLDISKTDVIERPTKELVERTLVPAISSGDQGVARFANPKVAPGLVRWHPDFASACAASRQSGKPVLLFQMMGNLDDQFC